MQFDFQVPQNGGMDISALGRYVKYKTGLGAIRVRASSGGYIDLTPGQSIRLAKEFQSINVQDRSGSSNQGVLVIGDVDFQDDSIVGSVSIIDGGVNSTLANKCFLGLRAGSIATAGKWYATYLSNPAASGKNVIVESIQFTANASGPLALHALASSAPAGPYGANKNVFSGGGAPSTAVLWGFEESSLALLGLPMRQEIVSANTERVIRFAEPVIIRPGVTLAVVFGTGIASMFTNMEWREEPL